MWARDEHGENVLRISLLEVQPRWPIILVGFLFPVLWVLLLIDLAAVGIKRLSASVRLHMARRTYRRLDSQMKLLEHYTEVRLDPPNDKA